MLAIDHVEAPVLLEVLHSLPVDAEVVIAGAYKGDTAEFVLVNNDTCNVLAFEPQEWAYEELVKLKAKYGERLSCFNYALVTVEDSGKIFSIEKFGTDAAYLQNTAGRSEVYKLKIAKIRDTLTLAEADLFIMNMEGYEYDLLPDMIDRHTLPHVLLVQYHAVMSSGNPLKISLPYKNRQEIGKGWFLYSND